MGLTGHSRYNLTAPQQWTGASIRGCGEATLLENRRPSVLIVAAKWWPLSARLAIALIRHGCRLSALCPKGHPLSLVGGLERIERYRGTQSLSCLSRTLRDLRPEFVIPCDDGVVAQLHALHAQGPEMRPLIERSLGGPER